MASGVDFGTQNACQNDSASSGTPASSMVGMSGADDQRVLPMMANALTVVALEIRQHLRSFRCHAQVDLAGEQVGQRRRRAAIGHQLDLRAG